MIVLAAPDPETTDAIGAALAALLVPGDTVLLEGDLGAGKTALARAIIRERLSDPHLPVPSPTFALVQPYEGVIHADLYRLSHADELEELGLFDDDWAIRLIEWPEGAPGLRALPGVAITIETGPQGEGRVLTIDPTGGRAIEDWIAPLARWAVRGKDRER